MRKVNQLLPQQQDLVHWWKVHYDGVHVRSTHKVEQLSFPVSMIYDPLITPIAFNVVQAQANSKEYPPLWMGPVRKVDVADWFSRRKRYC